MRTYKIRKYQQGKNKQGDPYLHYSLTIPTAMAEQLPAGMQFQIELTEEGILYRPIGQADEKIELLPTWARNSDGSEEEAPEEEEPATAAPDAEPKSKPEPRSRPKNNARGRQRPARKKEKQSA